VAGPAEAPAPLDPRSPEGQDAVGFVLKLGRFLHSYGYSAQRLESVLVQASRRLGLAEPNIFSTPTSLLASFGGEGAQRTFMLRVQPGGVDLGRLAALDAATQRVLTGEWTPAQGIAAIEEIGRSPRRYPTWLTLAAFAVLSAAVARFFGGGATEVLVGGTTGFFVGVLAWLVGVVPSMSRVFEPMAAFLGTALATALVQAVGPSSLYIATVAGIVALLPGLMLTTAMSELANNHLSSGTSRLSGAFMVFLGIAFGVALGNRVTESLIGHVATAQPAALPWWSLYIALGVAPLCFAIVLSAAERDIPWITLGGLLAFLGGRLGTAWLGLELGSFAGALVIGVVANVYARWLDRPASIVLVPGLSLLVPGSIGYRSLMLLMEQNVTVGVEAGFTMLLTAASLVAGLLVANVVGPPRKMPELTGTA
jgi:uncharacterized membrane protein YjjP (DUF1212 family)